jgi:hypothetical protein
MSYEIVGVRKGQPLTEKKRVIGPLQDHQRKIGEDLLKAIERSGDFLLLELREILSDTPTTLQENHSFTTVQ